MFEMYHSSRESFEYLKQFYIGDLLVVDGAPKPPPPRASPSDGFLDTLRDYQVEDQARNRNHLSF